MENEPVIVTPQPKIPSKKRVWLIVAAVLLLIVVAAIAFFGLRLMTLSGQVTAVLQSVPAAMAQASDKGGNGYPVDLPAGIKTDAKVTLSGGGTFDGTVYCVTGVNTNDTSVVYHIDSATKKPTTGACAPIAAINKPTSIPKPEESITSAEQVGVTWIAQSDAVSYTVQCATDTNFTKDVTQSTSAAKQNTCNNLNSGTTYYARVRSNNSAGAGPWSASISLTTRQLSLAPTDLTVKPVSSTELKYTWQPVKGATSYVIEWATDTSYTEGQSTKELATTNVTITGLKPATVYYAHVKAVTASFDKTHAAFSDTVGTLTLAR